MKIIKKLLIATLVMAFMAAIAVYAGLSSSLPKLNGTVTTDKVSKPVNLQRDSLGTAVINAANRNDAAYALGYAHGQDRFFQMDLLRRNAAGELAEIFGPAAIKLDERQRFHQFRQRAEMIVANMSVADKQLLQDYAAGVNESLAAQSLRSFEYLLTQSKPEPWRSADSLLVIFSMYLDLQSGTVKRDLTLTQVARYFGDDMLAFVNQNSRYQAAIDGSELATPEVDVPALNSPKVAMHQVDNILEPVEVGSNNWAVTGDVTQTGHAMLSDDMHLSFAVPIIWYRAQLNYQDSHGEPVQVTGVSLPGAPAIVVGSNNHVAWGFTNAYIDTADWIELATDEPTQVENEVIKLPKGEHQYELELSRFGPVKRIDGKAYALAWVAHQPYAVDMQLMGLETVKTVSEGLEKAKHFGIPVQNLLIVDNQGSAAWQPTGAVPSRTHISDIAQSPQDYQSDLWQQDESQLPVIHNPSTHRLWSANSRVMSADEHQRFGDGGYALGARAEQVRDNLFAHEQFDERLFFAMQFDNTAHFLTPWHEYLVKVLSQNPQEFAQDLQALAQWQQCACSDSVGYTLVRHFRDQLIDATFAPLEAGLKKQSLSLSVIKRNLETPMWQLIKQQPQDWLAADYASWQDFSVAAYRQAKQELQQQYDPQVSGDMNLLRWGLVNKLTVQHPFSKQMPMLSQLLDMPSVEGFGDSYMPAVQRNSFGASQRFVVQPGRESQGIMAIPGGQSGHPLSEFYRAGFDEYGTHQPTPLLPSDPVASLVIQPSE
ncbi:penicillin acylase family protein [Shewanella waksmanii]|uniref:penicillin acylase family protein n=1 Tax=Shewanella waksmanii TaxID=213783 RepID=UPI003736AC45